MALTNFAPGTPNIGTASEALTATAGGGFANALQLNSRDNHVTTVGTAADSVKLPPWGALVEIWVANDGANALAVFPYLATDIINAITAGSAFSVPAGKVAMFKSTGTANKWLCIAGA